MKRVFRAVAAISVLLCGSCASVSDTQPAPYMMKAVQLVQILDEPAIAQTASRYDGKKGVGAFREAVIEMGQRVRADEGVDLRPGQAVDRVIATDTLAMESAYPEIRNQCSAGVAAQCSSAKDIQAQLASRQRCDSGDSSACLSVAFQLQRQGFLSEAMQFARTACRYSKDTGCPISSQIAQERDNLKARAPASNTVFQGVRARPAAAQPAQALSPSLGGADGL